jgi:hypothetical protein
MLFGTLLGCAAFTVKRDESDRQVAPDHHIDISQERKRGG